MRNRDLQLRTRWLICGSRPLVRTVNDNPHIPPRLIIHRRMLRDGREGVRSLAVVLITPGILDTRRLGRRRIAIFIALFGDQTRTQFRQLRVGPSGRVVSKPAVRLLGSRLSRRRREGRGARFLMGQVSNRPSGQLDREAMNDKAYLRKIFPFWPTFPTVKCFAWRGPVDARGVWCACVLDRFRVFWRRPSRLSFARRSVAGFLALAVPVPVPESLFLAPMFLPCATVFARRRSDVAGACRGSLPDGLVVVVMLVPGSMATR